MEPAASPGIATDPEPVAGGGARPWSSLHWTALAIAFFLGIAVRLYYLPGAGYLADIEEFVMWVNRIVTNGLDHAFDGRQSFGPVMSYIWAVLGAVEPAFRTATDASDPGLRALMKLPAVLADLGLAALLAYFFRDRPIRAIAAVAIVLLNPAIWFDSAWWGQYESVFMVSILAAFVLAIDKREVPVAVLLAAAVLTKPQALPFLLPFAAWFLATGGIRALVRVAAAGALTTLVLWLPFIPQNGPLNYIESFLYFANERFPFMTFGAWNFWWIVDDAMGGRTRDTVAVLGPISAKYLGFAIAGSLSLAVAWTIWRIRTPRALALGLVATALISYCFLTTMHERYSYPAIVFLLLLIPDWRALVLQVAVSIVFWVNLAAAASGQNYFEPAIRIGGANGYVGSVATITITLLALAWALLAGVRGRRPDTSGGSAAATSGA